MLHLLLGFFFLAAGAAAKSLQSCLTLCDPIAGSPPGSPVPRILHLVVYKIIVLLTMSPVEQMEYCNAKSRKATTRVFHVRQ